MFFLLKNFSHDVKTMKIKGLQKWLLEKIFYQKDRFPEKKHTYLY